MAILESDIKLLKSERLTDYDDGGGHMTGNEVIDGQVNNLFPDISQLDRTYGRVSLRKAYPAILTDNTDTYYGAHAIVTDPPDDPNVNVTLFTTSDWADERSDARNRVESYLAMGNESRYVLYGDHLEGQRAVQVYCRSSAPSPEVGEVYILSQEADGYTPYEQYVRITSLISRVDTIIETGNNSVCGTFARDVITLEIANPLRYNFTAADVTCLTNHGSPTLVRTTVVADAAQYAGVIPLSQTANTGALALKVASIFGQLVPSTQMETPVLDMLAVVPKPSMVQSGAAGLLSVSNAFNVGANVAVNLYFGSPCCRGSVAISSPIALKDDGNGNIIAAGSDAGGYSGSIVYESGALTLTRTSAWNATLSATATPAGLASDVGHTSQIAITIQNRQYNYTQTMVPFPAPGTVSVDYRAQGKWIRLTDDGLGKLVGREGEGTGTINYATGSALLTVGALPDTGSSVIWAWGSGVHYERRDRDADGTIRPITIPINLLQGVKKSSISISYLAAGVSKTVTDDGSGNLTGHGAGVVDYTNGTVQLVPSLIPDAGSNIATTYNRVEINNAGLGEVHAGSKDGGGVVNLALNEPNIIPGTLRLRTFTAAAGDTYFTETIFIDKTGAGVIAQIRPYDGFVIRESAGTINYATGAVAFTPGYQAMRWVWNATTSAWESASVTMAFTNPTNVEAIYTAGTETLIPSSANTAMPTQITIDIAPTSPLLVTPGSVRILLSGVVAVDRSGSMVSNPSKLTNAGATIGSINYTTGIVTIDTWTNGAANTFAVQSLLVRYGQWLSLATTFRTPGSPLRPASLYIHALRASDSSMVSATADMNGAITGTGITGTVDVEMGVVNVAWSDPVLPDTITFNCVVYSNIPLDADLLGLDPVRLPMDGRVPVVKTGNVLVVHNTQTLTLPNPLTPGYVASVGRTRIAYAHVYDALGAKVLTDRFTANLDAGTVTFADPLDLTGYTQPLKIEHRIEDMALCTDVQITGDIAISSQLTHDFAANTSYLSSALIIGDLQGRVANLFEQSTWTAVWSDVLIGSAPTSSYDDTNHPFVVTNKGAATERWAIIFTSASDFKCVGETFGQIAIGNININFSPTNPATGVPYFTIAATGWGSGWATGNVLRFNTIGANFPVWLARTTLQGPPTAFTDNFRLQIRGDAD